MYLYACMLFYEIDLRYILTPTDIYAKTQKQNEISETTETN